MNLLSDINEKTLGKALLKLVQSEMPQKTEPVYPDHERAVGTWVKAMEGGLITGKPFSKHTVKNYLRYVRQHIIKYGNLTYNNLEEELLNTPADMFGRKDKYHRAIVCFAKFLDRNHSLEDEFFKKAKAIKPKRNKPPRRTTVTPEQLEQLYQACDNPQNLLLMKLLANTGLRASECCSLQIKDIDLEHNTLLVRYGKGGKQRRIGLNHEITILLKRHINKHPNPVSDEHVFLNINGQPMIRDGLLNRIRRIGYKVNIHVSPHALRRAFVTHNANQGRSLVMLQIACGHSDISTTRSYCQTSEDEVIIAMKNW